jgi:ribosomal protein S18 acetylase RimI-like enzyme
MPVVRRIRPEDIDILRLVRLAALAEAPSAFGSSFDQEALLSDQEWADRAQAGSSGFERSTFFAVAAEQVVGLVGGYRSDPASPIVELVSMWTDPIVRRRGVGRALVEAVIDWARCGGAQSVQLWVTRGNTPAENLYRTIGFVETGEYQPLPSDPCKDEARMALSLSLPA